MGCSCTKGEALPGSKKNDLRTTSENKKSLSNTESSDKAPVFLLQEKKNNGSNKSLHVNQANTEKATIAANTIDTPHDTIANPNNVKITENDDKPLSEDSNSLCVSDLPGRAKISKKSRKSKFFSSFTNFFREQPSSCEPTQVIEQSISIHSLFVPQEVAKDKNSKFQSSFTSVHKPAGLYSLYNLPIKAQYLLTAQRDFDQLNSFDKTIINSAAKDIQIYLSTPFSLSLSNSNTSTSIIKRLQAYSSRIENSCDLNLIDFDSILLNDNESEQNNLKYFRRLLGNLVLSDVVNQSTNACKNITSGLFIFLVFISDINDDIDSLSKSERYLCPSYINKDDFDNHIRNKLSSIELDLFNKWYALQKSSTQFTTTINYTFKNIFLCEKKASIELQQLLDILMIKFDEIDRIEQSNLREKYLKTIQQEEIEFVVQHIDPLAIIWVNIVTNKNESTTHNSKAILDLLQSHVLAHNYKEWKLDSSHIAENESSVNSLISQVISDSMQADSIQSPIQSFLQSSICSIIDIYVSELNKKLIEDNAPKIDKSLAKEIYSHYLLCKQLSSTSNSKFSSEHVKNSFKNLLDQYLCNNEESSFIKTSHPLIIYTSTPQNSFTSNQLIAEYVYNIMQQDELNHTILNNSFLVYRFCACTIMSFDMVTLIQSIFHQICYLLELHESWSFDSPENIIENLFKALEKRKCLDDAALYREEEECSNQELVIILDSVNRVIKSKSDHDMLLGLIKKLYNSDSSLCYNIRIVLTYTQIPIAYNDHIIELEQLFKDSTHQFDTDGPPTDPILYASNKLESIFKANYTEPTLHIKLLHGLIKLLQYSRYGYKQSEIIELLNQLTKTDSNFNDNQLNNYFVVLSVWFIFKHSRNLLDGLELIEICVDNSQILYRLIPSLYTHTDDEKLYKLVSIFYGKAITPLPFTFGESVSIGARLRAFEEIPSFFQANSYLAMFVLNDKWLINKCLSFKNIFYVMQDVERVRELKTNSDLARFDYFKRIFYKNLYALHQDPRQMHSKFALYATEDKELFKNFINDTSRFVALNYKDILEDMDDKLESKQKNIVFNCLESQSLVHNSKVFFISQRLVLAISQAQNEIKIWKLNTNEEAAPSTTLCLIRTIRLNKSPKDMRLLNDHTAVVLVDRNLHIFDLNSCKHLLDLKSTMNTSFPFFQVHDRNHVVLLARNRLSVILMKVNVPNDVTTSREELSESYEKVNHLACEKETISALAKAVTTKTYSAEDDMFLFKVGEDRFLNSLLVSKNGKIMVCGDEVQKPFPLLVWNLNERKLVYDLRQYKHEFITSIQAIGSTGKFMVCGSKEEGEQKNCLIVYDLSTGLLFKKLKAKVNYISVEISEELNLIIACLENAQILIYDLINGSLKNTIKSNSHPVDKIKLIVSKKANYFLTYDTKGSDWTIKLWSLDQDDILINSFTCPSRIISCNINSDSLYFGHENKTNDDILVAVSLYGFSKLLILRIEEKNERQTSSSHLTTTTTVIGSQTFDKNLNGIVKELVI